MHSLLENIRSVSIMEDVILYALRKAGVEEMEANVLVDGTKERMSEEYKNSFEYEYNDWRLVL